ncbi:PREDICTED: dehydrogenase/reductase SDR family member 7 [Nicrophorus vespilloides]|uniref:Dehydrogenase/reductase SDR family member 7 n=1 Tax=Nicrophorus vespilloides TaxID=110193 RepID=A0ABM1MTZ9_NICVS|nr:PREDICTED: dehydrogenase/reductase SDR family member 7 [Nicrophorus vespilloides]
MLWSLIGIGVFVYGVVYLLALLLLDCDLELAIYERFGKSIGRLKGKVCFITGASSGIGEQTAIVLARHGVKLVLAARRRGELERVKRACLEESKGVLQDNDVLVLPMDLCDLNSHKALFDRAARHFNGIDILFNNAGRSQRAVFENIEMSVHKELFELNVFSVVNLTKIAIDHFNQRGSGQIAVTSSIAGVMGVPYSASYTASKHAIHGFMNCLRTEKTGKHIAVTLLCPGPTFTNFLQESFTGKSGEKYGETVQSTDKRMTGQRCGQLCAIAIANKTKESWMAVFPLIPFVYLYTYFPTIYGIMLKMVGPEKMFKLRDSNEKLAEDYKN